MKHIVIFEIGEWHEGADITRVFSSTKKAMEYIPKGFKEIVLTNLFIKGFDYYAENGRSKKWLKIQRYNVE